MIQMKEVRSKYTKSMIAMSPNGTRETKIRGNNMQKKMRESNYYKDTKKEMMSD